MALLNNEIKAHLTAARAYGDLSYAKRLKVGALLVRDGRSLLNGRNGTPAGSSNICEDDNGNTLPEVLHAEANVILYAAKHGVSTDGATLVTTDSPCYSCALMIIGAGITKVYYGKEYRDTKPLDFLNEYDVITERIT